MASRGCYVGGVEEVEMKTGVEPALSRFGQSSQVTIMGIHTVFRVYRV